MNTSSLSRIAAATTTEAMADKVRIKATGKMRMCGSSRWLSDGIELSNILVTEDIIRKKLMSIRIDKAPGVDELVPFFWQLSQRR